VNDSVHAAIGRRKPKPSPSDLRSRLRADRADQASTMILSSPQSWIGSRASERKTPPRSGVPSRQRGTSAAGGRRREAGSRMTLQAANGRFLAVAILAATWDSRSTATVPCDRWRRNFAAGSGKGASTPEMAACIELGIIDRRRRAQIGSAGNCPVSVTTDEATTQSPGDKRRSNPPAIPKLMIPEHSLAVDASRHSSNRERSVAQRTSTPRPAAMRASNARPVTAMTFGGISIGTLSLPETAGRIAEFSEHEAD